MQSRSRVWSVLAASACAVIAVVGTLAGPAAAAVRDPLGSLDSLDVRGDVISVQGWAWAPESTGPTTVHFRDASAGYRFVGSTTTSLPRSDVARHVSGAPDNTGFRAEFRVPDGAHRICAYAIGGTNPLLGCRDVSSAATTSLVARGSFDSIVRDHGGYRVSGWLWAPAISDGPANLTISDETGQAATLVGAGSTGERRPDVSRAFPGAPATTGFSIQVPYPDALVGSRRICVTAADTGSGALSLGCRTVDHVGEPLGSFDEAISLGRGNVTLSGWVFDWSGSTSVHVYDNGRFLSRVTPDKYRSDVSAAYPDSPTPNGWFRMFTVPAGVHSLCVYAINIGPGENPLLSCRTVSVY